MMLGYPDWFYSGFIEVKRHPKDLFFPKNKKIKGYQKKQNKFRRKRK